MRKVSFDYYQSDVCPALYFDCKNDVVHFEETLDRFINSEEGKDDWFKNESKYLSDYAVELAISRSEFHFDLQSQFAENLILATENAVDMDECGNHLEGDIYYPVMMYCYSKFHKN